MEKKLIYIFVCDRFVHKCFSGHFTPDGHDVFRKLQSFSNLLLKLLFI